MLLFVRLWYVNAVTNLMLSKPACGPLMMRWAAGGRGEAPTLAVMVSAVPATHYPPQGPCGMHVRLAPATTAAAVGAPVGWSPLLGKVVNTLCFEMMSRDMVRDVRPLPVM